MSGQLANSFGPFTSSAAVTTTGAGSWATPRGLLANWGYTITSAGGSTSTVTSKHKLEGTLSDSTAPAAADIFDLSTGSGDGHVRTTGKVSRQVRINVTTAAASTSSTGVSVTAVVGGTL